MFDFVLDGDGDLALTNGDFIILTSDNFHREILLISEKGAFKENPGVGVGLGQFLESEEAGDLLAEIRTQFTADGMNINQLVDQNGNFAIDANYP